MKPNYRLSPSSLNLMKDCPRCFWLQLVKKLSRPSGAFPSLPSGVDRILKEHFDNFMRSKKLPPEIKQLQGYQLFNEESLLKVWRNNLKGIEWLDDKSGILLRGAVDNILVKGNKLVVLDYKTRGFPLKEDTAHHYQDQLDIYNLLLRKNGYQTEDYAYLLFYVPEKIMKSGEFVFNTDLVKMKIDVGHAEEIFRMAIKVLNNDEPESSENCEYCKWKEIRF